MGYLLQILTSTRLCPLQQTTNLSLLLHYGRGIIQVLHRMWMDARSARAVLLFKPFETLLWRKQEGSVVDRVCCDLERTPG